MLLLVLSGLTALFRSLTISLLNTSWELGENPQPCPEKLCLLPECVSFKQDQQLPYQKSQVIIFGHDVVFILRRVLYPRPDVHHLADKRKHLVESAFLMVLSGNLAVVDMFRILH